MEFLVAGPNIPFAAALLMMVGIGVIEGVALALGVGLSHALDGALGVDAHVDLDVAHHAGAGPGALNAVLGWLHVGRVPILILLVIFLFGFGMSGYVIQALVSGVTGWLLPSALAVIPAFFSALPVLRVAGNVWQKLMPLSDSEAVSEQSFVGRVAVVTLGLAERGKPAQAKLHDKHGHVHYVMVEPDVDGERHAAGTELLLVRRAGSTFRAILNTNPALINTEASEER